jgi:hypothetical protein
MRGERRVCVVILTVAMDRVVVLVPVIAFPSCNGLHGQHRERSESRGWHVKYLDLDQVHYQVQKVLT